MTLLEHAERELREAGLLDKDSAYDGLLGESVLELMKVFSAQSHSGASAQYAREIFYRVSGYGLLSPLKNPTVTGEYTDETECNGGKPLWQSTRKYTVFSTDCGKTWYDIDNNDKVYLKF